MNRTIWIESNDFDIIVCVALIDLICLESSDLYRFLWFSLPVSSSTARVTEPAPWNRATEVYLATQSPPYDSLSAKVAELDPATVSPSFSGVVAQWDIASLQSLLENALTAVESECDRDMFRRVNNFGWFPC